MEASEVSCLKKKLFYKRRWIFGILIFLILLIVCVKIYHSKQNKNQPVAATPVVVSTVEQQTVPVMLSALGTVTSLYTVTIRTQVNGQLLKVLFEEGQMVKKDDVLVEIDARPYQAQLTQYEGQLIRDKALLANAKVDLARYQTLWKQDSVSEQILKTQASLVQQYEGVIKVDQGLMDTAKVNLSYTQIKSPIEGRVGLRLVDPGNIVQTTDQTGIAVITMMDPITVIFTLPETEVPKVQQALQNQRFLTVTAYDRSEDQPLAEGRLLTMDNIIDPTTGTIKLKAQFTNNLHRLFPNQFVNIKLLIKTLSDVLVVPTAAIQYSPSGPFVYRLNDNNSVSMIPVVQGVTVSGITTIEKGLLKGQSVVIEGINRLEDGSLVTIVQPKNALVSSRKTP